MEGEHMNTITRRTFLKSSAISAGALILPWPSAGQTGTHWVFLGTYTNASGENVPTDFGARGADAISRGIYSFSFDEASGRAGPVQLAAEISNPLNLIMHSNKKFLYACRGQNSRINGYSPVTAFSIQTDGTLRELNTVPSMGTGPSVGMVDMSGRNLLTTNFSSNNIVCIRINKDGSLGENTAFIGERYEPSNMGGPPPMGVGGPGATNPPGPLSTGGAFTGKNTKPHAIVLSRTERFAVAAEINANRCHVMRFDPEKGSLETFAHAEAGEGCGPRHLIFHPSYRWLYTSNEENSSVSAWRWDEEKGSLMHLQQLSTLPEGFDGKRNHPADVQVSPDGRYVYVTNRTAGTIAGYRIDQNDGSLAPAGQTSIGSPASWGFIFDRTGRWAIVSAQIGDAVRIYSVEKKTGKLLYTGQEIKVVLPICVRMT
jgi:6-phosphogluconolactonase